MAAFCNDYWRHFGSVGMKELMVAVERVVRPMRADPRRKMKMRQELLAHLTNAYEEGKARLGNESLALEEAVRRFGNPTELTRELQASVPFFERVLFTHVAGTKWAVAIDRYMEGKPGESPFRHMVRWAWLWVMTCFGLLAGPALIIYQSRYDAASALMAVEWFAVTAVALGFFLICVHATYVALSGSLRFTAVPRATVFAALAVGTPAAASAAMLHSMLDIPIHYGSTVAEVVVGSLLILGVSFAGRFNEAARRRREEWTKLEIGD
jgi:hypothetical protein